MRNIILAIESSCDETAFALIDEKGNVIADVVNSQAQIFETIGGVIPEMASRMHVENIMPLFRQLLVEANISIKDIKLIATTYGPGLIGSLLVGTTFANSLSLMYNIPVLGINHMQAHMYSIYENDNIKYPYLSLIISGGHTELVLAKDCFNFEIIGETCDDALGECYDKVARLMGLGYPGGPKIEKLARNGNPNYDLPNPLNDGSCNFSFSGLKSASLNFFNQAKMKNQKINNNDFACSFQETIALCLKTKLKEGIKKTNPKTISVVGGVSCNKFIQNELKKIDPNILFPSKKLATDNAIMVGKLAYLQSKNKKFNFLIPKPNLETDKIWN